MRTRILGFFANCMGGGSRLSFSQGGSILQLAIFYTIMHGGILMALNGVFWDDWALVHNGSAVILDMFHDLGAFFNLKGHLHVVMLSVAGVWLYKILTFGLMFATGVLLYFILKEGSLLEEWGRYFLVLLFLILPFNLARIAIVDFPYTLCYFLFFLAWFLMERQRFISLLLFFLSFCTNSLLVFYLLPILYSMHQNRCLGGIKVIYSFSLRHLDFLMLPFLFFYIKTKFFSPIGLYAGYNQGYSLPGIPHVMWEQALDLLNFRINPYIFLLLLPLVFFVVNRKIETAADTSTRRQEPLAQIFIGLLITMAGAFPYWVIGIVPKFNDWDSRHQLLLPLGIALLIVGFVSFLGKVGRKFWLTIVIAGSLTYGTVNYYAFFMDWNKQVAIMNFFAGNSMVKNSSLILINDTTTDINALHRKYRFYEWNGLLDAAYGDQNRFVIDPIDLAYYQRGGFDKLFLSRYKAGTHRRLVKPSAVLVEISHFCPRPQLSRPGQTCVQDVSSGLAFSTTSIDVEKPPSYLSTLIVH